MIDHRIVELEEILIKNFKPTFLKISDDSHLHVGHAGAEDGKLHITISITSKMFLGLSRIKQHRAIYDKMKSIKENFHAVSIKII